MFNIKNLDTIDLLLSRRSEKSRRMVEPGPSADELRDILQCGMRVSDHGKIFPWRFEVFQGDAQQHLAAIMAEGAIADGASENSPKHKAMQNFALQAPLVIAVTFKPDTKHKVPEWEQELSVGAACQNILIAAHALGYVGQWLTGDGAYCQMVRNYLNLSENDKIAGFLFIGSSVGELKERPRPEFGDIVTFWPK
jgi:nitroreductase